jgi:hypothetical protein
MTLTIICGAGHINKYNLIREPKWKIDETQEGELIRKPWKIEDWKCPRKDCQHKEYINHVIDYEYNQNPDEQNTGRALMTTSILLLSFILTMKTRAGL